MHRAIANHLSIRSKLLLLLIISGLAAALAISVIGYLRSDSALRAAVWDQHVAIRETKKADIQCYLRDQESAFGVLASSAQLQQAIPAFRTALDQERSLAPPASLDGLQKFYAGLMDKLPAAMRPLSAEILLPSDVVGRRLQDRYIARNPNPLGEREKMEQPAGAANSGSYDDVHRRFHAQMVEMMKTLGVYDLFLIDDRTGEILYSVEKEADFATNLETGPNRNSNLARAFRVRRSWRTPGSRRSWSPTSRSRSASRRPASRS